MNTTTYATTTYRLADISVSFDIRILEVREVSPKKRLHSSDPFVVSVQLLGGPTRAVIWKAKTQQKVAKKSPLVIEQSLASPPNIHVVNASVLHVELFQVTSINYLVDSGDISFDNLTMNAPQEVLLETKEHKYQIPFLITVSSEEDVTKKAGITFGQAAAERLASALQAPPPRAYATPVYVMPAPVIAAAATTPGNTTDVPPPYAAPISAQFVSLNPPPPVMQPLNLKLSYMVFSGSNLADLRNQVVTWSSQAQSVALQKRGHFTVINVDTDKTVPEICAWFSTDVESLRVAATSSSSSSNSIGTNNGNGIDKGSAESTISNTVSS